MKPAARRRHPWQQRRRVFFWTVAMLLVVAGWEVAMLAGSSTGAAVLEEVRPAAIAISAGLGLVVTDVEVEGRETTGAAAIMAALGAGRGTPILAISPSEAKQRLEALPWVRKAVIERRLPGTLYIRLVERRPFAIWQHGGRHELIDRDGTVIPVDDLGQYAGLPVVVGDDAARHAGALLDMLASQPVLAARVGAAVRVGERRWNLRIDGAIDVLLPETNAAAAWAELARLEETSGLLKRDVRAVDMRLPDRLVVRVNTPPANEAAPAKKGHPPGKNT